MASPADRRREGYNAFIPGLNLIFNCPYLDVGRKVDWVNGWNKARAEYEELVKADIATSEEKMLEDEKWGEYNLGCPWYCDGIGWGYRSFRG